MGARGFAVALFVQTNDARDALRELRGARGVARRGEARVVRVVLGCAC